MPLCYHCGQDVPQTIYCDQCGQNYCSLHSEPINHDCNIVKETSNLQQIQASSPNYVSVQPSSPTIQEDIDNQQSDGRRYYQQYGGASSTSSGEVRGTTDGSFTWHRQEMYIPENAFDPDSGIEFKGILWSHKSELVHFLIGGGLMFLIGFFTYFPLSTQFNEIYTTLGNYLSKDFPDVTWMAFVGAGLFALSFLGHELGHRQMAVHFELQTKFRLLTFGMMLTIISIFIGIMSLINPSIPPLGLALPGAVVFLALEKVDNKTGWVKSAGPLFNLVFGTILLIIAFSIPKELFPLNFFILHASHFNFILGGFNLIPIGILDGRNIIKWNKKMYAFLVATIGTMLIISGVLIYTSAGLNLLAPESLKQFFAI